mgnify:CR=1 FL=1
MEVSSEENVTWDGSGKQYQHADSDRLCYNYQAGLEGFVLRGSHNKQDTIF